MDGISNLPITESVLGDFVIIIKDLEKIIVNSVIHAPLSKNTVKLDSAAEMHISVTSTLIVLKSC